MTTERKPALRSGCTCPGCMGAWRRVNVNIICGGCDAKLTISHYGHVKCPECQAQLWCEDDMAYERERDRRRQHKIDHTGDGRETMRSPGLHRGRR